MPIIKSAKKRVKLNKKAAVRNAKTKKSVKLALKKFRSSVKDGKNLAKNQSLLQSNIDKAAKKNVIHKNKANRLKSRMAKQAKASVGTVKKTAKKPTAKKSAAKKSAK